MDIPKKSLIGAGSARHVPSYISGFGGQSDRRLLHGSANGNMQRYMR